MLKTKKGRNVTKVYKPDRLFSLKEQDIILNKLKFTGVAEMLDVIQHYRRSNENCSRKNTRT